MAKKKAYVIMIREATQDTHEVFEHDEDLISKDKKRCWVRTSDPLITEKGERIYYCISTEPRTIPIGKGKPKKRERIKMGETMTIPLWELTTEEREAFGKYSAEKVQGYHDYRVLSELRKKIGRPFSETLFIIMSGFGLGIVVGILFKAGGLL